MQQVIIVIHLMVVVALIVLVLYQKSEGGALGIGGGGGLFTGRGQANALTRATGILAAIFFLTSLALTVLPAWERGPGEGFEEKVDFKEIPAPPGAPRTPGAPADGKQSIFEQLQRAQEKRLGTTAPAQPAPAPPSVPAADQGTSPPAAAEKPALRPGVEEPAAKEPEAPATGEGAATLGNGLRQSGEGEAKTDAEAPKAWKSPGE